LTEEEEEKEEELAVPFMRLNVSLGFFCFQLKLVTVFVCSFFI
jgi:hypothetical protein